MSGHSGYSGNGSTTGNLVRAGGGLAIAACSIGLLIFLGGCFGYQASFKFGFLPAVMAAVGLVLVIVGGARREASADATHVLAALFIAVWGIVGGTVLMAVAYHWHIFAASGGT